MSPVRRLSCRAVSLLATLLVLLALPAAAKPPTSAELAIDRYLSGIYRPDGPGAVVLVVRDGKTVFRKAYGLADVARGTRLTPEAPFYIASITKALTAAAVLRLVERGTLALDDEVTKHLPDYPTQGRRITLRHLLSHTSGIPDFSELPSLEQYKDLSPEVLTALFKDLPLQFEPGAGWAYSNSGYTLLGRILEKHGGKPFGEYLEAQLLAPLGMKHTVYASRVPPGTVSGHWKRDGKYVGVGELDETLPYAGGGLISTVDDLARWSEALDAGRVLREDSLRESFTRIRLEGGRTGNYGLGWQLHMDGPYEARFHGGNIQGFTSMLYRLPARKLTIVLLSNIDRSPVPYSAMSRLAQLALGEDWTPGRIPVSEERLARYVGTYTVGGDETYTVSYEGARLFIQKAGGPKAELRSTGPESFVFEGMPPEGVRFLGDGATAASGLRLSPMWFGVERVASRVR